MSTRNTPRKRSFSNNDHAFRANKQSPTSIFSLNSYDSNNNFNPNNAVHGIINIDSDDEENISTTNHEQREENVCWDSESMPGKHTEDDLQIKAIELARKGENIFLTGKA